MNTGRNFGGMPVPGRPGAGAGGMSTLGTPADHTWLIVFGDVIHLVIVLLVLTALLLALRMWLRSRVAQHVAVPAALTELDMLYARGEVTRDDYLARRSDLSHMVP